MTTSVSPASRSRAPSPRQSGNSARDAAAVVQQLALWLPADGRLLWQLGEIANATGDVRTAANILDGCVTEFAMKSPGPAFAPATLPHRR